MATSVLMASKDHQSGDVSLPLPQNHDHSAPPIRRGSGRRKGSKGCEPSGGSGGGQLKKKTPQRGMGVEKLERLRIQEGLKKMKEISHLGFGLAPFATAAPFSDHHPTFVVNGSHGPLQFPKLGTGFVAAPPNAVAPSMELIQNHGSVGGSVGFHGDRFRTDLLGVGCLNHLEFLGKNSLPSELSSTPNFVAKCFSEHCNICHKKKRVNGENSGAGILLRSDMYNNVGEWAYLGLNGGDIQNIINLENHVNGDPVVPHVGLAVGNAKQGVEVVAVHRKQGSSSAEGGDVLMEYEFFPSGKGPSNDVDDDDDDDSGMMKQIKLEACSSSPMEISVPAIATAAGMVVDHGSTTTTGGGGGSSSIDLSLKLSYY